MFVLFITDLERSCSVSSFIDLEDSFLIMDKIRIIEAKLNECEYPVQWRKEKLPSAGGNFITKLTEYSNENLMIFDELPLSYLITCIALADNYGMLKDTEKALENLEFVKKKFNATGNRSVRDLGPAFLHVLQATEVFLLKQIGDIHQAFKVASKIPAVTTLNRANRTAAQYGFRALFFSNYASLGGISLALESMTEATKLEPMESLWHFMMASFSGLLYCANRIHQTHRPNLEEFDHLMKAIKIKRAGIYLTSVAERYRQYAKFFHKYQFGVDKAKIGKLNHTSLNLFNEAMRVSSKCPEILIRSARGLILLPPPCRDLNQAKELLHRALAMDSDHIFGNHVMAQFYEKTKDIRKAIQHLKVCERKSFGATLDFIRLQFALNEPMDVVQRMEELLGSFEDDASKIRIYHQLVSYCLFVSKDFHECFVFVNRIVEHGDHDIVCLKERPYNSIFDNTYTAKKSLYDFLTEEVKNRLGGVRSLEDRKFYARFLNFLQSKEGGVRTDEFSMYDSQYHDFLNRLLAAEISTGITRPTQSPRTPTASSSWRQGQMRGTTTHHGEQTQNPRWGGNNSNYRGRGGAGAVRSLMENMRIRDQ